MTAHSAGAHLPGAGSLATDAVVVTRPEDIPAALAQGKPVLIDIPAVQWGLRSLATVQKWSGKLGWWIVKVIATWLIIQWLNAQVPNTGPSLPRLGKIPS
jgi:hypothetical protein